MEQGRSAKTHQQWTMQKTWGEILSSSFWSRPTSSALHFVHATLRGNQRILVDHVLQLNSPSNKTKHHDH
jgi:hypothetical protein